MKTTGKKILSIILTAVMIASMISLGALSAFAAVSGDYVYRITDKTAKTALISNYSGSAFTLTIPTELDGYTITGIDMLAFGNCNSLRSVTIPDSIKTISWDAFENCTSLTSVSIGTGANNIDASAFYGCTALTQITVAVDNADYCDVNGVLYNKAKTVLVCYPSGKTDTSFTIESSVTSILCDFSKCLFLSSIKVPSDNTAYCDVNGVLYNKDKSELICYPAGSKLSSYAIPSGVKTIGNHAFNSTKLESITIPSTVTKISDYAFRCSSLKSISIPESVTSIGEYAFICDRLSAITIGNGVTSMGARAFNSTAWYKDQPNGVVYLNNCLVGVKGTVESVNVKAGTTLIEDGVFFQNTSLTDITIPSSVKSISSAAFEYCTSLKSVTIADGLTSIGQNAFYDCTALKSIVILSRNVAFDGNPFDNEKHTISDIMFYGYSGSTTQTLANDKAMGFSALSEVLGDVNNDGKFSIIDAKYTLQFISGSRTFSQAQKAVADINGDGRVSIKDAKDMLKKLAQA